MRDISYNIIKVCQTVGKDYRLQHHGKSEVYLKVVKEVLYMINDYGIGSFQHNNSEQQIEHVSIPSLDINDHIMYS